MAVLIFFPRIGLEHRRQATAMTHLLSAVRADRRRRGSGGRRPLSQSTEPFDVPPLLFVVPFGVHAHEHATPLGLVVNPVSSLPGIPVAIFDTSRQPRRAFEVLADQRPHVDLHKCAEASDGRLEVRYRLGVVQHKSEPGERCIEESEDAPSGHEPCRTDR